MTQHRSLVASIAEGGPLPLRGLFSVSLAALLLLGGCSSNDEPGPQSEAGAGGISVSGASSGGASSGGASLGGSSAGRASGTGGSSSGGLGGSGGAEAGCPASALVLKLLLLIPQKTEVASPKLSFTFPEDELTAATDGFRTQFPAWVAQITRNRLCVQTDVVVSMRTMTTLSGGCTPSTPSPKDVAADLDEFAPVGRYDGIVLYAPTTDSPNCGGGPGGDSHGATFAYVTPRGANAWRDAKNDVYDAIIHEWMHGVIGFYENKAGVGPVPNIDAAGDYGYSHDDQLGWKIFLGDVLNREVDVDGQLRGLGEPAWAYGDIRHQAKP